MNFFLALRCSINELFSSFSPNFKFIISSKTSLGICCLFSRISTYKIYAQHMPQSFPHFQVQIIMALNIAIKFKFIKNSISFFLKKRLTAISSKNEIQLTFFFRSTRCLNQAERVRMQKASFYHLEEKNLMRLSFCIKLMSVCRKIKI